MSTAAAAGEPGARRRRRSDGGNSGNSSGTDSFVLMYELVAASSDSLYVAKLLAALSFPSLLSLLSGMVDSLNNIAPVVLYNIEADVSNYDRGVQLTTTALGSRGAQLAWSSRNGTYDWHVVQFRPAATTLSVLALRRKAEAVLASPPLFFNGNATDSDTRIGQAYDQVVPWQQLTAGVRTRFFVPPCPPTLLTLDTDNNTTAATSEARDCFQWDVFYEVRVLSERLGELSLSEPIIVRLASNSDADVASLAQSLAGTTSAVVSAAWMPPTNTDRQPVAYAVALAMYERSASLSAAVAAAAASAAGPAALPAPSATLQPTKLLPGAEWIVPAQGAAQPLQLDIAGCFRVASALTATNSTTFHCVQPWTLYLLRVRPLYAATNGGSHAAAPLPVGRSVVLQSAEDIPAGPPSNLTLQSAPTASEAELSVALPQRPNGVVARLLVNCSSSSNSSGRHSRSITQITGLTEAAQLLLGESNGRLLVRVDGLRSFTSYECRVWAATSAGASLQPANITFTTAAALPEKPIDALRVTRLANGTLLVNWTAPENPGGSNVSYEIWGDRLLTSKTKLATTTNLSLVVADGSSYVSLRLRVVNSEGGSPLSDAEAPTDGASSNSEAASSSSTSMSFVGLLIGVSFGTLFVIITAFYLIRRRRSSGPAEWLPDDYEVEEHQLLSKVIVGRGAFGEVLLADFMHSVGDRGITVSQVAVKRCLRPETWSFFRRELLALKELATISHKNVIILMGVCTKVSSRNKTVEGVGTFVSV